LEYPLEHVDHALSLWPGIRRHDGTSIWTARQAVIVLRIPDPEAQALVLAVAGLKYIERQRLSVSLDFAPPVEVTLIAGHARRVIIPINKRRDPVNGLVTLMISSPDASRPVTLDPASNDTRVMGVALFALQLV